MKVYNSFLVRCWSMAEAGHEARERYSVEHFQTGERSRPERLDEIAALIAQACQDARAERTSAQQASEPGTAREEGDEYRQPLLG